MKPITQRRWTRLTPWTIATGEHGETLIPILTFNSADDAEQAVREHNAEVSA